MAEVELEPHDPAWHDRFDREADRIRAVTDDPLGVFHIGSTAVPDLLAKPTLDVLAVYADVDAMGAARDALLDDEYHLSRDDPDWVVLGRHDDYPVVCHLRPRSADVWRDQLLLRELLRDDPEARREYERAKRRAVERYPDDVDGYTDEKESTIETLVARARAEGYAARLPPVARE